MQMDLEENLSQRGILSYKFFTFWKISKFDTKWLCCCRANSTRDHKLFLKANKKLN